jgi:hypothetical protein
MNIGGSRDQSPRDHGGSHDERGIANHGKTFEQILAEELAKENQTSNNQTNQADQAAGNWDEKKRRENQQYILLFGEKFVKNAISKKHAERLAAVDELKRILAIKMQEGCEHREEQRDYIRATNHFMGSFLSDGVKEVYLAGLELMPILINFATLHFGQQTDVNFVLETTLPILLKRSGEAVPNLDDVKNISKNHKPNEILNATVNIGTLGQSYYESLFMTHSLIL